MAGNGKKCDNRRHGYVGERTQSHNPVTGLWTKRDTQTGQFMVSKHLGVNLKVLESKNNYGIFNF